MSPESLFKREYSKKSDVYSFGVVIFEIVTQEDPWKDLNLTETVNKMVLGERMPIPKDCAFPPALEALMKQCWAEDPCNRPDFKKIIEYIENIDSEENKLGNV